MYEPSICCFLEDLSSLDIGDMQDERIQVIYRDSDVEDRLLFGLGWHGGGKVITLR